MAKEERPQIVALPPKSSLKIWAQSSIILAHQPAACRSQAVFIRAPRRPKIMAGICRQAAKGTKNQLASILAGAQVPKNINVMGRVAKKAPKELISQMKRSPPSCDWF